MRQIVLDTETTGIGFENGHRIIEIGCIELIDRMMSGRHFHCYLNPLRKVDEGAFRIHGLSDHFLKDKPIFNDVAEDFITFVDNSELIIHNAPFDLAFLNGEFSLIGKKNYLEHRCVIIDTLVLARKKHPGQRNNLDALCKRYAIDNSKRTLHGALLDAEMLASVYLAMTSGQTSFFTEKEETFDVDGATSLQEVLSCRTPVIEPNEEELMLHQAFIEYLARASRSST